MRKVHNSGISIFLVIPLFHIRWGTMYCLTILNRLFFEILKLIMNKFEALRKLEQTRNLAEDKYFSGSSCLTLTTFSPLLKCIHVNGLGLDEIPLDRSQGVSYGSKLFDAVTTFSPLLNE